MGAGLISGCERTKFVTSNECEPDDIHERMTPIFSEGRPRYRPFPYNENTPRKLRYRFRCCVVLGFPLRCMTSITRDSSIESSQGYPSFGEGCSGCLVRRVGDNEQDTQFMFPLFLLYLFSLPPHQSPFMTAGWELSERWIRYPGGSFVIYSVFAPQAIFFTFFSPSLSLSIYCPRQCSSPLDTKYKKASA